MTLPLKGMEWITGTSYTPTDKEWKEIKNLTKKSEIVFWRLRGRDAEGGEDFSEVGSYGVE